MDIKGEQGAQGRACIFKPDVLPFGARLQLSVTEEKNLTKTLTV